ncbi:telomerase reverse transcriptase-like [Aphidius gifuensis]|uniref:telomerase reverse transcriptase-like n=1 Tax=Aphidius gifuensis TaxID=684658 RepID=UPI001CDBA752|nr:telomerase reverse transcriptase-like [Aphidius gifuensis]
MHQQDITPMEVDEDPSSDFLSPESWKIIKNRYGNKIKNHLYNTDKSKFVKTKLGAIMVEDEMELISYQTMNEKSKRNTQRSNNVVDDDESDHDSDDDDDISPSIEIIEKEFENDVELLSIHPKIKYDSITNEAVNKNSSKNTSKVSDIIKNLKRNIKLSEINQERRNKHIKDGIFLKFTTYNLDSKISVTGSEIFEIIFANYIDRNQKCKIKQMLTTMLDNFKEKHLEFHYTKLLLNLPKKFEKYRVEMPIKLIMTYMSKVMLNVVPKELFGSSFHNIKLILRFFKQHLKACHYSKFPYNLCFTLKTNDVKWLNEIDDLSDKIKIMSIFAGWFINYYVLGIFKSMFASTKTTSSAKKIYMLKDPWQYRTNQYISRQKKNNAYEETNIEPKINSQSLISLELLPKKCGLRTIYHVIKNNPESDIDKENKYYRKLITKFLQQLLITNFECFSSDKLHDVWLGVVNKKKTDPDTKTFFIATDIANAFPSIDQNKLLQIIMKLTESLPSNLRLKTYGMLVKKNKNEYIIDRSRQYFDNLDLPLAANRLCCVTGNDRQITFKELQEKIVSYILNQYVVIDGKNYILKEGVAQGLNTSSSFSEIYYSTMVKDNFLKFKKEGNLFRYVDDFLYITHDEEIAKDFLNIIKKGINNYKCKFSKSKTFTNLQPYCNKEFSYLGYKFNIDTLQIIPEFFDKPIQYMVTSDVVEPDKTLATFYKRLKNIQMLKINQLSLSYKINNSSTIENTVKKISKIAADKCAILLVNMFEIEDIIYNKIISIMRKYIHFLTKKIIMNFCLESDKCHLQFQDVQDIIWKAHAKAINRKPALYKKIGKILKYKYSVV